METTLDYLAEELGSLKKQVATLQKQVWLAFGVAGAVNWILTNFIK